VLRFIEELPSRPKGGDIVSYGSAKKNLASELRGSPIDGAANGVV
jgi:hypothetical protein